MGILKSLFGAGKKDARRESPGARAQPAATGEARLRPGHSLSYDPALVDSLKDDHQDLVHIFQGIDSACRALDFSGCMESLRRFRSRFTDHLIVENTRFYLYVKHAMEASDPASAQLARDFQHEMHQIARVVTSFVDKYSVDEEVLKGAAFAQELQAIGRALAERIEREEKALYPLYLPVG
ncbi:MAG: hemerythrin domain-containing protein [Ramlibacter sp.]|nr:hemerythrin domain-containing protein [Ramlibacter sp.]